MIELKGKYSNAKIYTDNAEQEAIDQVHELINQPFVDGSQVRVMPDCLPSFTEVLTDTGFKLISELLLTDKVAQYKKDTKQIIFKEPTDIIIREMRRDEKMFEFKNKENSYSIIATENHRMAIKDNMDGLAKDVDNLVLQNFIWSGDGLENSTTSYSDNDIRILAWIIGDGSFKKTKTKSGFNYRISFGLKKQRKIDRLTQLLSLEKVGHSVYSSPKQTSIMINTESSFKYVQLLDFKKTYPKDFYFLSKEQALILFNEAIQIDGDYEYFLKHGSYRFNTTNKEEADLFSALACINYSLSKLIKRSTRGFKTCSMYYVNIPKSESLSFSKSGYHNKKFEKNEIDYKGNVVCLSCDTSFFIARQNGLTFVTGNCHAGSGCTIGLTMDVQDKVVPNLVGVDIGCGMLTVEFCVANDDVDLPLIDKIIHENVPAGKNVRGTIVSLDQSQKYLNKLWSKLRCVDEIKNKNRIDLSLGTLGGGNHFIEVGKMEGKEQTYFLVIHTGSRNLGKQVAEYYQEKAIKKCFDFSEQIKEEIQEMKDSGKVEGKDIGNAIKAIHAKYQNKVENKDLAYLDGQDKEDYLHDVKLCQEFADLNRLHIFDEIRKAYPSFLVLDMFNTVHNYIDFNAKGTFLRKGAIAAYENEKVLIPMNMRDGSIVAVGKGNEDWNYSAPHGAGRLMSRSKARKTVDMEEYKKSMEGIYTTCVNESTIDESPMSYKPMDEIIANVEDTVDIIGVIKPIYNFKASE